MPNTGVHLIIQVYKSKKQVKDAIGIDAHWIGQDEIESIVVFRENALEQWEGEAMTSGLHSVIWQPHIFGRPAQAKHLIPPLIMGRAILKEVYMNTNFWHFTSNYLKACQEYPEAMVRLGTLRV